MNVNFFSFITIGFLFLPISQVKGQVALSRLKNQFLTADSVILISHKINNDSGNIDRYKLMINGKVNNKLIEERKLVKGTTLKKLSDIVTRQYKDQTIEDGMCFLPHHSILIYKNKKVSFIDICFHCREFETSKDIKIPNEDFDNSIWNELETFFKEEGFTYGFGDEFKLAE